MQDNRSRASPIDGEEIISAWFKGSFGQEAYFESRGGYHNFEIDYKEDSLRSIALWLLDLLPLMVSELMESFSCLQSP